MAPEMSHKFGFVLPKSTVKAAIRRASQRLNIPFSRTRNIWHGDARRIDAEEIDRTRRGAEDSELAQAIAGIEVFKNGILASRSPASRQVVAGLNVALCALGYEDIVSPDSRTESLLDQAFQGSRSE
jgi:hypothetical protein